MSKSTKTSRPGGSSRVAQAGAPPARGGSSLWILAVVAVAVLAVGAIAIALRGGDDDATTVAAEGSSPAPAASAVGSSSGSGSATTAGVGAGKPVVNAPVTVAGAPLPAQPEKASSSDPAIGKEFPELSGSNVLDGSAVAIRNDGRPKIVVFLAHWCPHCQKEVPLLQKWLDANGKPQAVDLYAVSTSVDESRGNFPPAAWLTKERWSVPTLADSGQSTAFQAAGLRSFPSFVAIGADGTVVARASGELSTTAFEALLDTAASKG